MMNEFIRAKVATVDLESRLNLERKKDFPFFLHHPQLAYLDNAATTQAPRVVIEEQKDWQEQHYAPVHRSLYRLGAQASEAYESTRHLISKFIAAGSDQEIIFTANGTHALNLAAAIERAYLQAGDEIILSVAEHHSNILPWQRVARQTGATIIWLELTEKRQFSLEHLNQLLSSRTKVVSVAHVSNVLGYVAPIKEIVRLAHAAGARVAVDGTQAAGRMPVNMHELQADYYAVSGHKLYGPGGTGWLYARSELLNQAEPLLMGGGTIEEVTRDSVRWHRAPARFEAGTPNLIGVVGLGRAVEYLNKVGMGNVWQHDQALATYLTQRLAQLPGIKIYGQPQAAIVPFVLTIKGKPVHSHDVAEIADSHRVALRGGHHCAQVLMSYLQLPELCRASGALYNTREDVEALFSALTAVRDVFIN